MRVIDAVKETIADISSAGPSSFALTKGQRSKCQLWFPSRRLLPSSTLSWYTRMQRTMFGSSHYLRVLVCKSNSGGRRGGGEWRWGAKNWGGKVWGGSDLAWFIQRDPSRSPRDSTCAGKRAGIWNVHYQWQSEKWLLINLRKNILRYYRD